MIFCYPSDNKSKNHLKMKNCCPTKKLSVKLYFELSKHKQHTVHLKPKPPRILTQRKTKELAKWYLREIPFRINNNFYGNYSVYIVSHDEGMMTTQKNINTLKMSIEIGFY